MCFMVSGLSMVAGQIEPMPPVLGPSSLSRARLWSWAATSGRTLWPSESAKKETSSPWRNSSKTSLVPALPSWRSAMSFFARSRASSRDSTMEAPLPPASPSAFTTRGSPTSSLSMTDFLLHAAHDMEARRGNLVPFEEILGEGLAPLELGGGAVRTEDREAAAPKLIRQAKNERELRADDGEP